VEGEDIVAEIGTGDMLDKDLICAAAMVPAA
jgi:hypothetical protein